MRTIWMSALTLGLAAASTLAPQARAQAPSSCKSVVSIDSVYQKALTGGKFEYFLQLRNTKSGDTATTIRLADFPKDVTLFSPSLPNITLKPNESKQIRIGTGTNQQINAGSVKVYYDDIMSLPKPYVAATHCSTLTK